MTVFFQVNYNTAWGESLVLRTAKKQQSMDYVGGGLWQAVLKGNQISAGDCYTYLLMRDGKPARYEWSTHRLELPEKAASVTLRDRWIDRPGDSAF